MQGARIMIWKLITKKGGVFDKPRVQHPGKPKPPTAEKPDDPFRLPKPPAPPGFEWRRRKGR
jgi:hypothetical protein